MRKALQAKLEAEIERHTAVIIQLAEERTADFVKDWKRASKKPVKLLFGMGTMYSEVDGQQVIPEDFSLIQKLDEDIDEITNGHRIGVPDDVTI